MNDQPPQLVGPDEDGSMWTYHGLDEILTLADAADALGLKVDTLRWQIHNGKLAARKLGPRMWIVTADEVERYGRENRRNPLAQPRNP